MSIPSELGHLAMPTNFLAQGKNQMAGASLEPGTFRFRVLRSAAAPRWLGNCFELGVLANRYSHPLAPKSTL